MALPAILSLLVAGTFCIRGDRARLLAKCLAHDEVAGLDHGPFPPIAQGTDMKRTG